MEWNRGDYDGWDKVIDGDGVKEVR